MEDPNVNLEHSENPAESVACASTSEMDNESDPSASISHSNPAPSTSHQGSQNSKTASKKKNPVTKKQLVPFSKSKYKYSSHEKEDHGQPIYGCKFYQDMRDNQPLIFATVGSCRVTIYKCTQEGSIKQLQCFEDDDADAEESFFTCAWSEDENGKPLTTSKPLPVSEQFPWKLEESTRPPTGQRKP